MTNRSFELQLFGLILPSYRRWSVRAESRPHVGLFTNTQFHLLSFLHVLFTTLVAHITLNNLHQPSSCSSPLSLSVFWPSRPLILWPPLSRSHTTSRNSEWQIVKPGAAFKTNRDFLLRALESTSSPLSVFSPLLQ